MFRRRWSPTLFACLCFTSLFRPAPRPFAPDWKVGDWWVTKVLQLFENKSFLWHLERYEITDTVKVDNSDCFVLKIRLQSSKGHVSPVGSDFYVRRSDWRIVRRVKISVNRLKLLSADTTDYPSGHFGPLVGEPRLPRFPLQFGRRADTLQRLVINADSSVVVREVAGRADAAMVQRVLADGDTTGRKVVRPTGVVEVVRSEATGEPDSSGTPQRIQSLQLWCREQPWRLYEELVRYSGAESTGQVIEQTWLLDSGHAAP
jgi:hypothetical protein